jgi:glycosyltransferase 2 family protein
VWRNPIVQILLKYVLGFGLLVWVIWKFWNPNGNVPGIRNLIQEPANWWLALVTVVLVGCVLICQISRWYLLVRALDLPFQYRDAIRLGTVGYFYNMIVPGSVGGDAVKAVFIARDHPERRYAAGATVVIDRLLGLFGLLLLAAVIGGICWSNGDPRIVGNEWLKNAIRICVTACGVAITGWVLLGLFSIPKQDAFGARLTRLAKPLGEVWGMVCLYRRRPMSVYQTIPLTAFGQVLMVLYLHCAVRVFAAGSPGELSEHFIIGPIGFIGQAFIPAPGGVGGAEALFGYLYTILNRAEASGVIGRLTIRLGELFVAACGYILFLSMRAELKTVETGAEPVPPTSVPVQ